MGDAQEVGPPLISQLLAAIIRSIDLSSLSPADTAAVYSRLALLPMIPLSGASPHLPLVALQRRGVAGRRGPPAAAQIKILFSEPPRFTKGGSRGDELQKEAPVMSGRKQHQRSSMATASPASAAPDAVVAALSTCGLSLEALLSERVGSVALIDPGFVADITQIVASSMAIASPHGGGSGAGLLVQELMLGLGALLLTTTSIMQELVLPALKSRLPPSTGKGSNPASAHGSDSDLGPLKPKERELTMALLAFPLASGLLKPPSQLQPSAPNLSFVPKSVWMRDSGPGNGPSNKLQHELLLQLKESVPLVTNLGTIVRSPASGSGSEQQQDASVVSGFRSSTVATVLLPPAMGGVDLEALSPGFMAAEGLAMVSQDYCSTFQSVVEPRAWTWLLRSVGTIVK